MEEDPEDTIPLSQKTRVTRVVDREKRKSQSSLSPMTEEYPIQVEKMVEEEAYV